MLETDKQIYLYRYRLLDPDVDIDIFEASNFELESHNLLCLVWTVIVRAGSCMIHQQADLAEQWVYGLAFIFSWILFNQFIVFAWKYKPWQERCETPSSLLFDLLQ